VVRIIFHPNPAMVKASDAITIMQKAMMSVKTVNKTWTVVSKLLDPGTIFVRLSFGS
jgi:hypothetical protein